MSRMAPGITNRSHFGMNYRMTDMQAALIISQLNKLPRFMERRKAIVKAYNEAFSRLPQLFVQQEIPESDIHKASVYPADPPREADD